MFKTLSVVGVVAIFSGCAGGDSTILGGSSTGSNPGGKTDTVNEGGPMTSGEMGGIQTPDPGGELGSGAGGELDMIGAGGDADEPLAGGNEGAGGAISAGGMADDGLEDPEMDPEPQGGMDAEPDPMIDPFAQALDVNLHRVEFPEGTPAPIYRRASVNTGFSLGGTEFWQQWPNGHMPTYSYSEGTEVGKRCMYASARRFEAIMSDPPAELLTLLEESEWRGSFFNWNDDFSQSEFSDGRSARLWAWRTHLIKWISQTNLDGSCFLPTYEMVVRAAESCLSRAQRSAGEIQGCRGQ